MNANKEIGYGFLVSMAFCALFSPTQAMSMTFVAIGTVSAVGNYVLFADINKLKLKSSKKFLNIGSKEKNQDATATYKELHNASSNATFKGNHSRHDEIDL